MAGYYDKHMFSFIRISQTVFPNGCIILHSTNSVWEIWNSKSIPTLDIVSLLSLTIQWVCEVLSHYSFNSHFPDD